MSGVKLESEVKGGLFLGTELFIEDLAGRCVAKTAFEFAEYLRARRFSDLFVSRTGGTLKSIGAFRAGGNNPSYIIKAGIGVPGNLNYLAGLYRGKALSRSGKPFDYAKKRDLLRGGWAAWNGNQKMGELSEQVAQKMLNRLGYKN